MPLYLRIIFKDFSWVTDTEKNTRNGLYCYIERYAYVPKVLYLHGLINGQPVF